MMKGAHPRPPPPPPPPPPAPPMTLNNGNSHGKGPGEEDDKSSLTAAADLIRTLDSAFAEMSSLSASAARDAEDARRNARAASEVARRYTARSYPNASLFDAEVSYNTSAYDEQNRNAAKSIATPSNSTQEPKPSSVVTDPERYKENDMFTPQPSGGSGRKRKTYKAPLSSERLAQSHAEDVLSLSLDLERSKQALENEQMAHDETRSSLTEARSRNVQLEAQVDKLLNDLETQREDHGRQMDGLNQEIYRANARIEAAEEDAQLALDLAKGNADSREQLESWLQRALQEVNVLREQLERVGVHPGAIVPTAPRSADTKKNSVVRFAENPTVVSIPSRQPPNELLSTPRSQASRSMVAAGRHLLQRALVSSPPEDSKMHSITLTPEKSADRRQKLRERLRSLEEDVDIPTPAKNRQTSHSKSVQGIDMNLATKAMENCQVVAKLLRETGRRLEFSGHWFTGAPSKMISGDDNIESMTRQFCHSVEVKLGRQRDEIKELEALCDYLEQKLVVHDELAISRPPEPSVGDI